MPLASFTYGKQRVRALVVRRHSGGQHDVHEIDASVMLEGDFADTYLTGDNGKVVPTDTIKNTVQLLAHQHLGPVIEEFAVVLANHFLKRYQAVSGVTVEISSQSWSRLPARDGPHPHAFAAGGNGQPFCRVRKDRETMTIASGVAGMLLLKSTNSAFVGYPHCEYTTLPETDDRILATQLEATWTFRPGESAFPTANRTVLDALTQTFAEEFSPSVQNTLYLMGSAALDAEPAISDIRLAMPNKHYLPVNLSPFGVENNNVLFLPTDEPFGQIEACLTR
jgi:urate oxidase